MKDNIISFETSKGGLEKKEDDYSSKSFTADVISDMMKEIAQGHAENASGIESGYRGDSMSNENFNLLFKELKDDMRERESRTREEINEREKRFEKSLEKFSEDAREREERYMKSIEEIKSIVRDGEKNQKSTTIAVWTLSVTTLLGIAAMVITLATSI